MNLRDLEYFKYLAESLSFTKTAEYFFVSQPSISIALKRLEDTFETKLIMRERSAKNIYLTPAGKLLYQRANDILALYLQTKEDLSTIVTENTQLGITREIYHTILPNLLAHSNEPNQNLELIQEKNVEDLIDSLRHHKYSSAILPHETPHVRQKWLTATPLYQVPLKIWISDRNPLSKKDIVSIDDIKDLSFISYPKGSLHEQLFYQWALYNKLPLDKIFYSDNHNIISTLIANDSRIALMADFDYLLRPDIVSIELLHAPTYYISLVVNNEVNLSSAQIKLNQQLISSNSTEETD